MRGVQKRGNSFLTGMSKKRRAEKMEKSSEKESLPCLLTLKIRTKIDNLSERCGLKMNEYIQKQMDGVINDFA